jgi:hypothetical protein
LAKTLNNTTHFIDNWHLIGNRSVCSRPLGMPPFTA